MSVEHTAKVRRGTVRTELSRETRSKVYSTISTPILFDLDGAFGPGATFIETFEAKAIIGVLQAALDELDRTA